MKALALLDAAQKRTVRNQPSNLQPRPWVLLVVLSHVQRVLPEVGVACLELVSVNRVPVDEQVLDVATVSSQVGKELVEGSDGQASVLQSGDE